MDKKMYDSKEMHTKDYHKGKDQFAGEQMGSTVRYIERHDRQNKQAASKIKSQRYMGRYS
jgi:hypothetical protein